MDTNICLLACGCVWMCVINRDEVYVRLVYLWVICKYFSRHGFNLVHASFRKRINKVHTKTHMCDKYQQICIWCACDAHHSTHSSTRQNQGKNQRTKKIKLHRIMWKWKKIKKKQFMSLPIKWTYVHHKNTQRERHTARQKLISKQCSLNTTTRTHNTARIPFDSFYSHCSVHFIQISSMAAVRLLLFIRLSNLHNDETLSKFK